MTLAELAYLQDQAVAAGYTPEQVAALAHWAAEWRARQALDRKLYRAVKVALTPALPVVPVSPGETKADSGESGLAATESAFADGLPRSAPVKSAARHGLVTTRRLRPAARLVAARLVEHHNLNNGRCDPGLAGMARDLGLSVRSVRRAIGELEDLQLVARQVHAGRGWSNSYRLDLGAMAALAVPIGKADSVGEMRTAESAKPDSGVRQNRGKKQSPPMLRARPDPAQRSMFLPISGLGGAVAADKARQRIHADIADAAMVEPSLNVSTLTDRDWTDATAAEVRRAGSGLGVIRERLEATGPPKLVGTG